MQVLTFSNPLLTIVPTVVNWANVKDVYETNTATRIRLTVFRKNPIQTMMLMIGMHKTSVSLEHLLKHNKQLKY